MQGPIRQSLRVVLQVSIDDSTFPGPKLSKLSHLTGAGGTIFLLNWSLFTTHNQCEICLMTHVAIQSLRFRLLFFGLVDNLIQGAFYLGIWAYTTTKSWVVFDN